MPILLISFFLILQFESHRDCHAFASRPRNISSYLHMIDKQQTQVEELTQMPARRSKRKRALEFFKRIHRTVFNKGARPRGTLILVRSGESIWNVEQRFTGWSDVPITEEGIKDVKTAGALLR
jgi:hypothetical protein